jgi:hypothetical protein
VTSLSQLLSTWGESRWLCAQQGRRHGPEYPARGGEDPLWRGLNCLQKATCPHITRKGHRSKAKREDEAHEALSSRTFLPLL